MLPAGATNLTGASDFSTVSLWIKAGATSPSAKSCMLVYDRAAGVLRLAEDSGNGWLSVVPGAGTSTATPSRPNTGPKLPTPPGGSTG